MSDGIKRALGYIKSNCSYIEKAIYHQCKIWRGEKSERPVLALSCGLTEEQNSWLPYYNTKEIHFDKEKMFSNGLRDVLSAINGGYGAVPSMRANMGCGIIPSLFGIQQRLFEDKMPWMLDHVKKENIKESYNFKINAGAEFTAAMEHMEYMSGILNENGLTGKVFVFPLDMQGAVDTAHLVYGDTIFYDFYEDPEFVHHLLELSCEAIYFSMDECFKRIEKSDGFISHYNNLIIPAELGGIKTSEDTTTLLSPVIIDEFAKPYLNRILERFNGGYVHYCGKNDHLLNVFFDEPLARGINFGNPEKHEMTKILERCKNTRKVYTGGISKKEDESFFDYFRRILEPAYDKNTGCFYIIPQYSCSIGKRENIIGEFERAADWISSTTSPPC